MSGRTKTRRFDAAMLVVASACLLIAVAACAQTAPPDTADAGEGTVDDPWIVDLDELMNAGLVVADTEEGPVNMGAAAVDTIRVTAPRMRVSELVRRIGEAMDEAGRAIGPHGFTQIQRITTWKNPDDSLKVERTEYAELYRIHLDADGERRMTRLRSEERKWKGGEEQDVEIEDELTREWQEDVVENTMSMPFDLLSANRYRYTIKERNLIGDHLIFRIGFEPRSDFEPGLAGDVWIDVNDFVIRRMEGAMVGPMPAAPILKGVPRFVFTLRKDQGRWVADGLKATVLLNRVLPFVPNSVDIEVSLQDYVFDAEVH